MSGGVKPRLFVDMDGTLAVFRRVENLETLYEPGYFATLPPIRSVVDAVKLLIAEGSAEIYVLSAVLSDSRYAEAEKRRWLRQNLPELPESRVIFPPCGTDKSGYVPGGLRPLDYILDDYTLNLQAWSPPENGIKLLNGINHTRRTWRGHCVSSDRPAALLARDISDIVTRRARIADAELPRPHVPRPPRR